MDFYVEYVSRQQENEYYFNVFGNKCVFLHFSRSNKKKRIYISHAYRSSATVDQNVSWDFVFCEAVPGFHFINGLYLLGHKPKNITSDITF